MLYKGYSAHIEFDEGDRIFVGHLAGIRDIVGRCIKVILMNLQACCILKIFYLI